MDTTSTEELAKRVKKIASAPLNQYREIYCIQFWKIKRDELWYPQYKSFEHFCSSIAPSLYKGIATTSQKTLKTIYGYARGGEVFELFKSEGFALCTSKVAIECIWPLLKADKHTEWLKITPFLWHCRVQRKDPSAKKWKQSFYEWLLKNPEFNISSEVLKNRPTFTLRDANKPVSDNDLALAMKFLQSAYNTCSDNIGFPHEPIGTGKELRFKVDLSSKSIGFIFNTANIKDEGNHWVALFIDIANQYWEYFDSFANEPCSGILDYIRQIKDIVNNEWNINLEQPTNVNIKVQTEDTEWYQSKVFGIYSFDSGPFCLWYLERKILGMSIPQISQFVEEYQVNDTYSRVVLRKHFWNVSTSTDKRKNIDDFSDKEVTKLYRKFAPDSPQF